MLESPLFTRCTISSQLEGTFFFVVMHDISMILGNIFLWDQFWLFSIWVWVNICTLSTIKGHILALAVLFQRLHASHALVKAFHTGCCSHCSPVTLWDVRPILLTLQPFWSIRDITWSTFIHNVAFLVAINLAQHVSELRGRNL